MIVSFEEHSENNGFLSKNVISCVSFFDGRDKKCYVLKRNKPLGRDMPHASKVENYLAEELWKDLVNMGYERYPEIEMILENSNEEK